MSYEELQERIEILYNEIDEHQDDICKLSSELDDLESRVADMEERDEV